MHEVAKFTHDQQQINAQALSFRPDSGIASSGPSLVSNVSSERDDKI
jgi:hypothetical protein